MTDEPPRSILSHGERDVARRLRDGQTVAEIADARDTSTDGVEKAIDRIREKTERALTTLAESPFSTDLATDFDLQTRRELRDALCTAEDDR